MAKLHIICGRYYDFESGRYTVGGIQTYNTALRNIAEEMGIPCILYQPHETEDEYVSGQTKIVQVAVPKGARNKQKIRLMLNRCRESFDVENDILLFNTDSRIQKNYAKKSIAIQHGISWDIPRHENKSAFFNSIYTFNRSRHAFKILQRLRNVGNVVCVDYNFPNWYRSVAAYEAVNMKVIPNFTQIAPRVEKDTNRINIIFARRFEVYRGTRLFSDAISKILKEYPHVYVTVAGSGPDEPYIKDKLSSFGDRITFTKYTSDESLAIHAQQHIAVIPTIGSEGTSLSLLEAMSAQCAVVCTNVGGMTNIVIDGYNGFVIAPKEKELYSALKQLIEDKALCSRLSERAYETVKEGFSYEKWKGSWKKIFEDILY